MKSTHILYFHDYQTFDDRLIKDDIDLVICDFKSLLRKVRKYSNLNFYRLKRNSKIVFLYGVGLIEQLKTLQQSTYEIPKKKELNENEMWRNVIEEEEHVANSEDVSEKFQNIRVKSDSENGDDFSKFHQAGRTEELLKSFDSENKDETGFFEIELEGESLYSEQDYADFAEDTENGDEESNERFFDILTDTENDGEFSETEGNGEFSDTGGYGEFSDTEGDGEFADTEGDGEFADIEEYGKTTKEEEELIKFESMVKTMSYPEWLLRNIQRLKVEEVKLKQGFTWLNEFNKVMNMNSINYDIFFVFHIKRANQNIVNNLLENLIYLKNQMLITKIQIHFDGKIDLEFLDGNKNLKQLLIPKKDNDLVLSIVVLKKGKVKRVYYFNEEGLRHKNVQMEQRRIFNVEEEIKHVLLHNQANYDEKMFYNNLYKHERLLLRNRKKIIQITKEIQRDEKKILNNRQQLLKESLKLSNENDKILKRMDGLLKKTKEIETELQKTEFHGQTIIEKTAEIFKKRDEIKTQTDILLNEVIIGLIFTKMYYIETKLMILDDIFSHIEKDEELQIAFNGLKNDFSEHKQSITKDDFALKGTRDLLKEQKIQGKILSRINEIQSRALKKKVVYELPFRDNNNREELLRYITPKNDEGKGGETEGDGEFIDDSGDIESEIY